MLLPQAGDEGVLTPELSKRLGVAPKLLLRAVPELCKKYGVKVRDGKNEGWHGLQFVARVVTSHW